MVEWQQYYAIDPFGNERADLRSAMTGVTVANEIRAIASGLAGKDLGAIQIKDLMLDTLARERTGRKEKSRRRREEIMMADRAAAENYYKLWSQSIKEKAKDAGEGKGSRNQSVAKPAKPSRSSRKRSTSRRS